VASVPVRKLSKDAHRRRVHARVRTRLVGTPERPRLNVYRSVAHIYAQVIDDMTGRTVVSAGSTEPKLKTVFSGKVRGGNVAGAVAIGQVIAERLKEKKITRVVFDRGGNLYHGRIKAVAESARKAGLEF